MPWVDNILDRVQMPKYISILDQTNWGMWQEPLTSILVLVLVKAGYRQSL